MEFNKSTTHDGAKQNAWNGNLMNDEDSNSEEGAKLTQAKLDELSACLSSWPTCLDTLDWQPVC